MLERHIKQSHDPTKEIKTAIKGGNFGLKRKSLNELDKVKPWSPSPGEKSGKSSPWKSVNEDENKHFNPSDVSDFSPDITSNDGQTLEDVFLEYTQFLNKDEQAVADGVVKQHLDQDEINGSKNKHIEDGDKIDRSRMKEDLDPVLVEQSAMDEPWYCLDCKREFKNTNPYVHHMTVHVNAESQSSEPTQSDINQDTKYAKIDGDEDVSSDEQKEYYTNNINAKNQQFAHSKTKYLKQTQSQNKLSSQRNKDVFQKDSAGNLSWYCAQCDKNIQNVDPFQHHMTTHVSAGNLPSWFCMICNKEIQNTDPYLHNLTTHLIDPSVLFQSFLANQILHSQQGLNMTNQANSAVGFSPSENAAHFKPNKSGLKRTTKHLKPIGLQDVSSSNDSDSQDSADVNHNLPGESSQSPKTHPESPLLVPKKKAKQFTYTTLCPP